MRFTLVFAPKPCPRPRIAIRGRFPVAYYPKPYAVWKADVAKAIKAYKPERYDFPVVVDVTFTVKRPKSTTLEAPKPDIDNYLKALLDAMTDAGVWSDDKYVVTVHARKRWGSDDLIDVNVTPEYLS